MTASRHGGTLKSLLGLYDRLKGQEVLQECGHSVEICVTSSVAASPRVDCMYAITRSFRNGSA